MTTLRTHAKVTDIGIFGQHLYLGSRKLEEVYCVLENNSYVRAGSVTYHKSQSFPEVII